MTIRYKYKYGSEVRMESPYLGRSCDSNVVDRIHDTIMEKLTFELKLQIVNSRYFGLGRTNIKRGHHSK